MKNFLLTLVSVFLLLTSCSKENSDSVTLYDSEGTEYVFIADEVISNKAEINEVYFTFKTLYKEELKEALKTAETDIERASIEYEYFKSYLIQNEYSVLELNNKSKKDFKEEYVESISDFKSDIINYKISLVLAIIVTIYWLHGIEKLTISFRVISIVFIVANLVLGIYFTGEIYDRMKILNDPETVKVATYRSLLNYDIRGPAQAD